jgi:hypothetical protein
MIQQFRDPWSRFASTGRIDDYISYRKHFDSVVKPAGKQTLPDISAGVAISAAGLREERAWIDASVRRGDSSPSSGAR